MKSSFPTSSIDRLAPAVFCLVLVVVLYPHLQLDFWNDELYTLKNFVFVPVTTTLTDFHVPNNHVLFNLVNNLYLKIIGIESLYELMDAPWKLRLLPLLYSCLTGYYLYKLAKTFFNREVALLSLAILLTSVPFYNFALQVRGYGLSMLWLVMIVYYCLAYFHFGKKRNLSYIAMSVSFALYTLPLNLYFIISLWVILLISILNGKSVVKTGKSPPNATDRKSCIFILLSSLAGVLISLAYYSPMLQQLLFNPYLDANYAFTPGNFRIFPVVLLSFNSKRYLLTALVLIGFALTITSRSANKNLKITLLALLGLMTLPMVISIVRNDHAPERAFVNLLPFFALFCTICACTALTGFRLRHQYKAVMFSLVVGYCLVSLYWQISHINRHLYKDLQTGGRSQGLYYNYYLKHFNPLQQAKYFYKNHYSPADTVIILDAEPHGFTNYLDKFGIPFRREQNLEKITQRNDKKLLVVTRYPNQLLSQSHIQAFYRHEVLNNKLSYNNIVKLTRIAPLPMP